MAGAEFERLQVTHPDIVRIFDEHTAAHEQALQEKQAQQMQMMVAARGGQPSMAPGPGQMPMDAAGNAAQRQ
jgi:hypothetical protein